MIVPGYVSNLPSVGHRRTKKLNKTKAKSKQTKFLPHIIQISIETETRVIKIALGQEINGERQLQNLDVSL